LRHRFDYAQLFVGVPEEFAQPTPALAPAPLLSRAPLHRRDRMSIHHFESGNALIVTVDSNESVGGRLESDGKYRLTFDANPQADPSVSKCVCIKMSKEVLHKLKEHLKSVP
jgi:hypothetical protein